MNQGNSHVCTTENNQDMEIAKEDRPFQKYMLREPAPEDLGLRKGAK